jgi:hypothetical protein
MEILCKTRRIVNANLTKKEINKNTKNILILLISMIVKLHNKFLFISILTIGFAVIKQIKSDLNILK